MRWSQKRKGTRQEGNEKRKGREPDTRMEPPHDKTVEQRQLTAFCLQRRRIPAEEL
jgi:hypothetical protein